MIVGKARYLSWVSITTSVLSTANGMPPQFMVGCTSQFHSSNTDKPVFSSAWAHLILYGEEATRQAQKEGEEAAAAYEQEKVGSIYFCGNFSDTLRRKTLLKVRFQILLRNPRKRRNKHPKRRNRKLKKVAGATGRQTNGN